jgi:hypothetical protein
MVKVHRPGFGSISAVPATQAVTGRSDIGSPIRPTGRGGRVRKTVAASEGFRDAKGYLGFKQARIACIQAGSRLFAWLAIALLVLTTLATPLRLHGGDGQLLLRRVVSRRRNRCELSLITIRVSLLHQEWQLWQPLSPLTKFNVSST